MIKLFLVALLLAGCGRAQFSGDSDTAPTTSAPIIATGTDYYLEIGQSFADQISGEIDLTNIQVFGTAKWPGINSLQFEMRAALTGTVASGSVAFTASQPPAWSTAVPVLSATIPANSNQYQLLSGNLKDSARNFLTQGKYWILVRVRYAGLDLSNSLTLSDVYVHAEGEKSLQEFSPLTYLGF